MRRSRVCASFAEVTQQTHSLRASGVMSSQVAFAALSVASAFFRSAGSACTGPAAVSFLAMPQSYQVVPSVGRDVTSLHQNSPPLGIDMNTRPPIRCRLDVGRIPDCDTTVLIFRASNVSKNVVNFMTAIVELTVPM